MKYQQISNYVGVKLSMVANIISKFNNQGKIDKKQGINPNKICSIPNEVKKAIYDNCI